MRTLTQLVLFISFVVSASAFADPVLTFEAQAVVAQVTPGARTAWFAVVAEPSAYTPRTSEYAAILEDTDNDGVVRFDLELPQPVAVWLVVDMSNGERAIGGPSGTTLNRTALSSSALRHGDVDTLSGLIVETETLAVCWVVRPSAGAWRMVVEDTRLADSDGLSDGSVISALSGLEAVAGSTLAQPEDFIAGDIVVTVNLDSLAVADLRVE
jgi:hypothetical protein